MRYLSLLPIVLLALTACGEKPASKKAALPSVPNYSEAAQQYLEKSKAAMEKMAPEDRDVMQRAAEELARLMPEPGLKIGEIAPEFALPDHEGNMVNLSSLLKEGPVVLVFYRGAWCPFCNLHLHALNQSLPHIKQQGAQLLAVTPQKPDKSAAQIEKDGYPFHVLSDLDSIVMKVYNLYFEMDPELVTVYNKLKLDIAEYNGEGRYVLPVPGTFIIDQTGVIRAVHATTDYKERMEPADIIATLKEINSQSEKVEAPL